MPNLPNTANPSEHLLRAFRENRSCREVAHEIITQWGERVNGLPTSEWVCEQWGLLEDRYGRQGRQGKQ